MNPQTIRAVPVEDDVDFTGRTIGRYVIVALIRAGAQGRVYRGRDSILGRPIAIKVLSGDETAVASSRQGLIAEARALSSVNHPSVAGVYDFVRHAQREFMVMEFIAGATLEEVLAGGPLPPAEVARLGAQLARGLAAIHAASIAHCDIKPANVKITSSGLLKIVDFGLARCLPATALVDSASTTAHSIVGTLPYMAPEVLRGQRADDRSDIFSAGAVLYEMATACRAFPQRTLPALIEAIEKDDVTAPSRVNPSVSQTLERVVLRALKKTPSARYQTATALAEALDDLMSNRARSPDSLSSDTSRCWQLTSAAR